VLIIVISQLLSFFHDLNDMILEDPNDAD